MPYSFWFYSVVHSTRMMNAIPQNFGDKLALSFLLVHGVGHNKLTWFPLLSLCYFNHDKDGSTQSTHNQSHTINGISIGRSPTSKALLVYNPRAKTYYEPDSYHVSPYWLLFLVYPQLQYNGGFFCYLLGDKNPTMEEPYPPGTWVKCLNPNTNLLLAGTVISIPLSLDNSGSPLYLILFDNGTAALIHLAERWSLIPPPPVFDRASPWQSLGPGLLPPFLAVGSCIMYEHEGTYHKGYLTTTLAGTYCFSFKAHVKKKSKDWELTFQTYPSTGWTFALRAFFYQDTSHVPSFNYHCWLHPPPHLIPLPV